LELKDAAYQKPFVIVVSGASNVGKSAVIKLANHKLRLVNAATTPTTSTSKITFHQDIFKYILIGCQNYGSTKPYTPCYLDTQSNVYALTIEDMTYPVQLIELSIDLFDTMVDPLQLPKVSIHFQPSEYPLF
jgi:GTP-binding protein EngB required for normal cell division